jgi:hypothetical protein
VDPRDPLQFTDGVYSLLARYYFLNNANLWLWGIYGSGSLKGLETIKTKYGSVESGGRCQFPVPKGELAVSVNSRQDELGRAENRLALDGNWDIGPGVWFELCSGETITGPVNSLWQSCFTAGGDYTLNSGMTLTCEHFIRAYGAKIDRTDTLASISALSAAYSPGIMDSLNAMFFYGWEQKTLDPYFGWQRTYDDWKINLIAFSSPGNFGTALSGTGVQLVLTFNH